MKESVNTRRGQASRQWLRRFDRTNRNMKRTHDDRRRRLEPHPRDPQFSDTAGFAETCGFDAASGRVWLEGQYLVPRERASKTLYLFMHPSSTLHLLPMPAAPADAGLHVLCAASRYPKNDSGLIMEKVAIDMGAWIKDARARGYETVILVGWSGGGSLSLFYQAEAEAPSIVATPAGDPVDLARAGLEPADGVIFIAAHLSRAETILRFKKFWPRIAKLGGCLRKSPRTCFGIPSPASPVISDTASRRLPRWSGTRGIRLRRAIPPTRCY